ncbi:hypothetical protein HanPSC8_Chr12g0515321 [Helianthus annuus]|nr:hypothetical protein HanPSC8_Chr12g0515321 [Helianthus annuus]
MYRYGLPFVKVHWTYTTNYNPTLICKLSSCTPNKSFRTASHC